MSTVPFGQLIDEAVGEVFHLCHEVPEGLHPQGNAFRGVQHKEQVHGAVWGQAEQRGTALLSTEPLAQPWDKHQQHSAELLIPHATRKQARRAEIVLP